MKRFFVALIATFCLLSAKSYADDDIVFFPDSVFKYYLVNYQDQFDEYGRIDLNGDGEIQYSEAEAFDERFDFQWRAIKDVTGIKAFTAITELYLSVTGVRYLDLSGMSNLLKIHCGHSELETLDISGCTNLIELNCYDTNLTFLDASDCHKLEVLGCFKDKITYVNLSNCVALTSVSLSSNQLTNIDLSDNINIKYLGLHKNSIMHLDLSPNIHLLGCGFEENNLNELNIRNGFNYDIDSFRAYGNPDLKCITVDDVEWSKGYWTEVDEWTEFSEDCSSTVKDEDIAFKIYPNPANSQITIKRETIKQADLRILNIKGQICLSQTIEHGQTQIQIDISKLSNGSYIVEIDNETTSLFISK